MSCLISSAGLFVSDSRSSEFSGSPILEVLVAIFFVTTTNFVVKLPILTGITAKGLANPHLDRE